MAKPSGRGVIYVMTTAVPGLVKIGQTTTKGYQERMRHLESNGYNNVTGLKRFFAIEVADCKDKERLLLKTFGGRKVGDRELIGVDHNLMKQLLLAFDGRVVYPEADNNKNKSPAKTTKTQNRRTIFSFYKKGLENGDKISFVKDSRTVAYVAGEALVNYKGKTYKLSPLTRKIYRERGNLSKSGAYRGASHWQYRGRKLEDLPDI